MAGESTKTWKANLTLHSTMSPFTSPLPGTHGGFKDLQNNKTTSWKRFNIAGILVTIYGLEELQAQPGEVACLWLLHGRGDTQDSMSFCAAAFLQAWNQRKSAGQKSLICVTLDQRNHGSRYIDGLANESWKAGNPRHAQDMFTNYHGSSRDVSMLIDHLPSYIAVTPSTHLLSGVSLGGHATWHGLLHDSRISAGIVVIGCPDYARMMTDRAIRSKLSSCTSSDPPGQDFLGSADFPMALVEAVGKYDPAGLLLSQMDTVTGDGFSSEPSEEEKARIRPILSEKLGSKKILCLSGGKDRLVPYKMGEPFLDWLNKALDPQIGWSKDCGARLEDIIDAEAGHEFSANMRIEAERFLCDVLADGDNNSDSRSSKI